MLQFLQLIASGIAQGCIYGLIALGFVLIYKATETINFAQGDLMMLGGFLGLTGTLALGLPFWAAFAAALVVMLFFGMALERAVLRPLLGQPGHECTFRVRGHLRQHGRGAIARLLQVAFVQVEPRE